MTAAGNILSLDGAWGFAGLPEHDGMAETPFDPAFAQLEFLPAEVPGNVEFDLARAGILPPVPELLKGLNLTRLRAFECWRYFYRRTFDSPEWAKSGRAELIFHGIDCFGTIWLNGREIGRTRNAKIRYAFDVSRVLRPAGETNTLVVRLDAPLDRVRDCDYSSVHGDSARLDGLYIRKPLHAFGTDICPRVLTGGLWRSVELVRKCDYEIRDMFVAVDDIRPDGTALVSVEAFLDVAGYAYDGLTFAIDWRCGSHAGKVPPEYLREITFARFGAAHFPIPDARLWYPFGYGEQPLYEVTLTVLKDGVPVTRRTVRTGLRVIELDRTDENLPEAPGRFHFLVNHVPVFIRGANWIWAELFHSRDRFTALDKLRLFREMNCNMVRIAGAGLYESSEFFDFCDENGLLVWQDLGLSSLPYPETDDFAELYGEELRFAVAELRNHPSLALWCGDNEGDTARSGGWYGPRRDPDTYRVTRETAARIVRGMDPYRPYLPSSPYLTGNVARKAVRCTDPIEKNNLAPEAHVWGPRDYCKSDFYFRKNRTCFASEAGFFGMADWSFLQKYLSPEAVWPPENNPEWNFHCTEPVRFRQGTSYRVAHTLDQNRRFFDGAMPEDPPTMIRASQAVLAESDKFLAELYRARRPHTSGLLLWNMVDSWPQSVSDAFVDYDMHRKLVFHYLRRSFAPFLIFCAEPENGRFALTAANETLKPASGHVRCRFAVSGAVFESDFSAAANGNTAIASFAFPEKTDLVLIEWTANGKSGCNHYLCGRTSAAVYLDDFLPQIAALDGSFRAEEIGR